MDSNCSDVNVKIEGALTNTSSSCENFGDALGKVMSELTPDTCAAFLKALSGLNASESAELCQYVLELSLQKKLRVIEAMSGSTVEGKKKFIVNLRKKVEARRLSAKQAEAELLTKRSHEQAANMNKTNSSLSFTKDPKDALSSRNSWSLNKSRSNTSIAPADIHSLGKELFNAHISGRGPSELHLVALEQDGANKKNEAEMENSDFSTESKAPIMSKRERPLSNWELMKNDQSAEQRAKSEEKRDHIQGEDEEKGDTGDDDDEDQPSTKRWTKAQDDALRESVKFHGEKNWKAIASRVPGRNHAQCLQRWRKVLKPGLVKGHWSYEEDQVLEALVRQGCNNWGQVAEQIPGRTPKQCRERWRNHLDPSINKGPYTLEEDSIILENQDRLGNRWSLIAQLLQGRTEDSVKIRWKSLKQNPLKAQQASRARSTGNWQSSVSTTRQQQQMPHQSQRIHQHQLGQQQSPFVTSLDASPEVLSMSASPTAYHQPHTMSSSFHILSIPDPTPFPYSSSNSAENSLLGDSTGSAAPNLVNSTKLGEHDMQMYLNHHSGDPHVEDLDDLVNTVKNITDGLSFDFGFEDL